MSETNLNPLLIGERINVITIKMRKAMEAREKGPIQEMAVKQVEAGANCLDLNAGPCPDDPERLAWLTQVVQEVVQIPSLSRFHKPQSHGLGPGPSTKTTGAMLLSTRPPVKPSV